MKYESVQEWNDKYKEEARQSHKSSIDYINEVGTLMRLVIEVRDSWHDEHIGRRAEIYFNKNYTWERSTFDLRLFLGEEDNIRSVSDYLRPFKMSKLLRFEKTEPNISLGQVGCIYRLVESPKSYGVELMILLNTSRTCKQVKIGERVVPIYEIQCDDLPVVVEEPEYIE